MFRQRFQDRYLAYKVSCCGYAVFDKTNGKVKRTPRFLRCCTAGSSVSHNVALESEFNS